MKKLILVLALVFCMLFSFNALAWEKVDITGVGFDSTAIFKAKIVTFLEALNESATILDWENVTIQNAIYVDPEGLTIGESGSGYDVIFYGDTVGSNFLWDMNGDTNGSLTLGTTGGSAGVDVTIFGDTNGKYWMWDQSADSVVLVGAFNITGNAQFTGTVTVGVSDTGHDVIFYGNTAANNLLWDESEDDLMLVGIATKFDVAGTTDSTSVTTGAVSIDGGLGVAKSIFVGGNISIATAKKITTVAELTLNSVNPFTLQFGGVDAVQIDEAAIAAFAAAEDIAGHAVYLETEDGGVDGGAASTGMAGGALSIKTGDGSVAVTAGAVGGAGGALSLVSGTGLTGDTAGNGGVGGAIIITAGAGGDSGAGAGVGGTGGTITLTAGAGGGAGGGTAGIPGKVDIAAGLLHIGVQTIDMADTTVVTTLVPGTPAGTLITGNILYVDANGAGAEILNLPHEADGDGVLLVVVNTGGESITIQNDAGGAVLTLETLNTAFLVCDGTTWRGAVCVP